MLLENALLESSAILFSCDKYGTIILQQGGGLSSHGIKQSEFVGLNAFIAFKEIPGLVEAIKQALKGKPIQAVYKWVVNIVKLK